MDREWGRGVTYNNSTDRQAALPHWLEHYNTRRRHSGIGNRTPINRVHNVLGQDT
jgi:transposase InsO family protein